MTNTQDQRPEFDENSYDPATVFTVSRYTSARNALRFYRVMALITGTMLLILTAEMIYKYIITPIMGGDPSEALLIGNFNLAAAIAITHGWCYVVYLVSCWWLNSVMKWKLTRMIVLALAGVVPVMSFILERKIHREVDRRLDEAVVIAPKVG